MAENKFCVRCGKTTRHYYAVGEHAYRCMECGLGFEATPKTNQESVGQAKGNGNGHSTEK